MKKCLFTLVMLLTCLLAHAGRWTAATSESYDDGYAVSVRVNVNGAQYNANMGEIEIAAFINGSCRSAVTTNSYTDEGAPVFNQQTGFFIMRVMGSSSDNNKSVNFKINYNGLVYNMTKTVTYSHQGTYQPMPFVLNLDAVTGVSLPDAIEIEQNLGTTYNLANDVSYTYNTLDGSTYTAKGESSIDTKTTPISYIWDAGNSTSYFTVQGNTLTTVAETERAWLGLTAGVYEGEEFKAICDQVGTSVKITVPKVPVTGISLTQNTVNAWVGESVWDYVKDENIVFTPSNASNKAWAMKPATGSEEGIDAKLTINKKGTWYVDVYSVENQQIKTTLKVVVKQHVESLGIIGTAAQVTVNVGENAFDAAKGIVTVSPDDADNKTLNCKTRSQLINANGVAQSPGECVVFVTSDDNPQIIQEVTVVINQPVTSITAPASLECWLGDNFGNLIDGQVTVLPANASNKSIEFAQKSGPANGMNEKGTFEKSGQYVITITSESTPSIYKDVTVTVKEHVASIYLSTTAISVNVGDNVFNAIKAISTVLPATATNKELTFSGFSADYINAQGVAIAPTTRDGIYLVVGSAENQQISERIKVRIHQPVTGISVSPSTFNVSVGENIYGVIKGKVTVTPANASDSDYELVVSPENSDAPFSNGAFSAAGTYKLLVVSTDNKEITATITCVVKQPVEELISTVSSVTVKVGESVYDAIKAVVTVSPSNATNKNLVFSDATAEYISSTGVALKVTPVVAAAAYVTVKSEDNPQKSILFTVNIINPVTGITATPNEITVELGENVADHIAKDVTISLTPATVDQFAYTVAPSNNDGNYFPNNIATTVGDYTWYATSTENAEFKATITVHVIEPVELECDNQVDVTIVTPGVINVTLKAGKESFDPELVTVSIDNSEMAEVIEKSQSGLKFTVAGKRLGETEFKVKYNGKEACTGVLNVSGEIALASGWNWISNYTSEAVDLMNASDASYKAEYFSGASKIQEIRSQGSLLFNDATYGVFGQISELKAGTMYKVNATGQKNITLSVDLAESVTISKKGYTWISYPVIGNHTIAYINNNNYLSNATQGDVIIGKDGFAEYDGTKWVGSEGFKFETGKGYIYYQENAAQKTLNFGESYVVEQSAGAKSLRPAVNVWNYDASAYSDAMCIVAKIKGIEAGENYTVGAFVDGECRGKGTFVNDEVMFINVAGNAGEVVSFKLYNSETEEYTDINEKVSYAAKKGSISAPIQITASETTGINDLSADEDTESAAYNLAGQRVNSSAKGIVLKGGKKYVNK